MTWQNLKTNTYVYLKKYFHYLEAGKPEKVSKSNMQNHIPGFECCV